MIINGRPKPPQLRGTDCNNVRGMAAQVLDRWLTNAREGAIKIPTEDEIEV